MIINDPFDIKTRKFHYYYNRGLLKKSFACIIKMLNSVVVKKRQNKFLHGEVAQLVRAAES